MQGRVKGRATGAIAQGSPLQEGPRDEIYLLQIKYSFEKFLWFRSDRRIHSILYSYVALSIKGPQQQLISVQVW